jgi:uncharacterized Zn ribbon protein
MKVLRLNMPNEILNGFATGDDPVALKYLTDLTAVYESLNAGTLYCRFFDGDRKGSIARLSVEPGVRNEAPVIGHRYGGAWQGKAFAIHNHHFYTVCSWTGRKNKVKVSFPNHEAELLLNYEGPTVWEKFDAKAAKEEALKNPDQRDIDGNVLNVGDRVLYINARYGARMVLTHGTIKEFKAVADSKGVTITTIVEDEDGELSAMLYPESMIYLEPDLSNE